MGFANTTCVISQIKNHICGSYVSCNCNYQSITYIESHKHGKYTNKKDVSIRRIIPLRVCSNTQATQRFVVEQFAGLSALRFDKVSLPTPCLGNPMLTNNLLRV